MKTGYRNYKRMYESLQADPEPQGDVAAEEEVVKEEVRLSKTAVVSGCDAVNMRSGPSMDSDIVVVVPKDKKVTIIKEEETLPYYFVEYDKFKGYISKVFLTVEGE